MKTTGYSRVSKDNIIRELEKELKERPSFFITRHGTISATLLDKLRANLRKSQTRYFVVKKTLGRKALENAKLAGLSDKIDGPCGIAFSGEDVVAPSKTLVEFAKQNENFKIQAAYFEGQAVGAEQVKALASLPPREVLIARVVGGVQAPISRFVTVLSATVRQVVTVLDAIAKKKGGAS